MIDHYSLPPDKLVKAVQLAKVGLILELGGLAWTLVLLVAALRVKLWSRLRDRLPRWLFIVAFLVILSVWPLPFEMWGHRVSLVYGLSVEGWGSWFGDQAKALALSLVIGTPLVLGAFFVLRRSPRRAWLWIAAAAIPVQLFFVFASPYLIEPLFYRFEPLSQAHAPLVAELGRVIAKTGEHIPPERMFLMKASDKHTTLNAYVTGFGASKRVVVWDTTADQRPTDEVLFIFGHELGHYVLGHIVRGIAMSCVVLFFALFLAQHLTAWLLARWGDAWGTTRLDDVATLGVLAVVFVALGIVGEPIGNTFSRAHEHDADIYGQEVVHGLVADPRQTAARAFQALGEQSYDLPDPNPFRVWWSYSHPSISERVRFAATYDPWAPGAHPRYLPGAPTP